MDVYAKSNNILLRGSQNLQDKSSRTAKAAGQSSFGSLAAS